MMHSEQVETMDLQDLRQMQIERLQATLQRAYRNVAFYGKSFDDAGVDITALRSADDLRNLPFTTRNELSEAYPYGMFALPLRDIVRIHSTSGTTATPVVVGYSTNDLKHWSECTARVLAAAGISQHDVVQIAFTYSLFTGGLGFHQGAELIGASVIPSSAESVERQIAIMRDYKTTALLCTPSYALRLATALGDLGVHPEELTLRVGLFGAEPWSENLRSQIEGKLHIDAYDNYGLTEVMGPGVAFECEHRDGLHLNEDHLIAEIVDSATLDPVQPGERGELVFTTITKEGFPLIRYRTGDIAALIPEPCRCGRTLTRISRIEGRTDDLVFYKGIKVFPSQIEQILLEVEGTAPHYLIVLAREGGDDVLEIRVELSEAVTEIDELKNLEHLRDRIAQRVAHDTGISAKITLAEPRSLRTVGSKAKRVVDTRG